MFESARRHHPFFTTDICYLLGFFLEEPEIRVFSALLGTQFALYVPQRIQMSRPIADCQLCRAVCATNRGFFCSSCRRRYGRRAVTQKVAADYADLLAIGPRFLPANLPNFQTLLDHIPRVCAGYAFAPAAVDAAVLGPLREVAATARRRLLAGFHLEITSGTVRPFFETLTLDACSSSFARLVLRERREITTHAAMVKLAASVSKCLRFSTVRELETRISDNTTVADLEKRNSAPALEMEMQEISDPFEEPPLKRLKVPAGPLRGQTIDTALLISDQNTCRALVKNDKFKNKFPLEWRELKRLLTTH